MQGAAETTNNKSLKRKSSLILLLIGMELLGLIGGLAQLQEILFSLEKRKNQLRVTVQIKEILTLLELKEITGRVNDLFSLPLFAPR